MAQSGHDNWCSNVFEILEKLNLEHLFYERKMVDVKEIKDQLMNNQSDMWKQAVPKKTKLRTYCLFKETIDIENYIKYNLSSSERSAMAQFRFGILPLNIETRRFRNQALDEMEDSVLYVNLMKLRTKVIFSFNAVFMMN